jgi:hypothetical protein
MMLLLKIIAKYKPQLFKILTLALVKHEKFCLSLGKDQVLNVQLI